MVPPTTVIVPEKEQEEWRMRQGLILQEFVATVQTVSQLQAGFTAVLAVRIYVFLRAQLEPYPFPEKSSN